MRISDDYGDKILGSQEALAKFMGASRERVNRELRRWQAEGPVTLGRARVVVLHDDDFFRQGTLARSTRVLDVIPACGIYYAGAARS